MSAVSTLERLQRRCAYEDRGHETLCLIFRGSLTSGPRGGYGRIWDLDQRRAVVTHRVTYEHFVGPVPNGMQIDHLCRQRDCCNSDHLEVVSARENTLRGGAICGVNARKTHCIHGHELTPENTITEVRLSTGALRRRCRACSLARKRASYHATRNQAR